MSTISPVNPVPHNTPEPSAPTWRERIKARLQPYVGPAKGGAGLSVGVIGLQNAAIGGLALLQGFSTQNKRDVAVGSAALITGVAQCWGGWKMLPSADGRGVHIIGNFLGAGAGVVAGLSTAIKVVSLPAVQKLHEAAQIAIGVSLETSVALVGGALSSVLVTIAAEKTLDLYYGCRDAWARRANVEASTPLTAPELEMQPEDTI